MNLLTLMYKGVFRRTFTSIILVISVFISIFSIAFLNTLAEKQRLELEKTIEMTTISCYVTDNKGLHTDGLGILSSCIEMLAGHHRSQGIYLDDAVTNIRTYADFDLDLPFDMKVRKILNFDCDPLLENAEIRFFDGYSEDIFLSEEMVCLVPEGTEYGDDGYITMKSEQLYTEEKDIRYRVIGTYEGVNKNIIYVPFFAQWVDGTTFVFTVDHCSFDIKNTAELEKCKEIIYSSGVFVEPDILNEANSSVFGVIVQDELFLDTTEKIESNIRVLEILQIAAIVIVVGIGFLTTFLSSRTREKEYAVMRCIGLKKTKILVLLFFEHLLLALAGAVLATALGLLAFGMNLSDMAVSAAAIFAFLTGSVIASYTVVSKNTVTLMKTEE